jgi:hypothetical protein
VELNVKCKFGRPQFGNRFSRVKVGLGIFASWLDATTRSQIDCQSQPLQGTLVNLDRHSNAIDYRAAIGQLADFLLPDLRLL